MKQLLHAPIIEAVLDIDCDMPPKTDLEALENQSRERFQDRYPKLRKHYIEEHKIQTKADQSPGYSTKRAIQSLLFLQEDQKQLVQVRAQGFSFNRLAPYSSLDDYLPEIARAWKLFVGIASPVQIRVVRLRYINRIMLPMEVQGVDLSKYFKIYPVLPDDKLNLSGFLNQYAAVEKDSGNQANIVLTGQPQEGDKAPIIFDITATWGGAAEIEDWAWLLKQIMSLRGLKNRIFENTLTEQCLSLFQKQ